MSTLTTSTDRRVVAETVAFGRKPRHDADQYQITVMQAHGGEVVTSWATVSRHWLEDSNTSVVTLICESLDRSLLEACGHVDRGRLWGSSPTVFGEAIPGDFDPERVHVLNGPHEGESRYGPDSWHGTLHIAAPWGEATYLVKNTALGRVGIFLKQHQYRGHLYD